MLSNNDTEIQLIVSRAIEDRIFRIALVRESLFWFMHIYFPEYLRYSTAPFQKEIIKILQDDPGKNFVLSAFRGSGKSTIVSMIYVLWAMLGVQNKRFIVLISNTIKQSETLLYCLKDALEKDELLKSDLGPFQEFSDEWKNASLIFKNYDTKIIATSVNESIRGIRYKDARPQLIICDDVETLEIIRSDEGKDKILTWFDRDIVPLGDEGTRIIVLGTIMVSGGLLNTLSNRIFDGELNGIFRMYPIINENNESLWNSRWNNLDDIKSFRKDLGIVEKSWQTEYLLNDWVDENQIISPEMIHYYEFPVPEEQGKYRGTIISVDPAVSQKQTADYTAIVCGEFYGYGEDAKLYILPNPINLRLEFPKTKALLKNIYNGLLSDGKSPLLVIEDVGTQKGFIQDLKSEGYPAKEFSPGSSDKYARLWRASTAISNGQVVFPSIGAEQLINQLTNFGVVIQHDDLVDACVMAVLHMLESRKKKVRVYSKKCYPF